MGVCRSLWGLPFGGILEAESEIQYGLCGAPKFSMGWHGLAQAR